MLRTTLPIWLSLCLIELGYIAVGLLLAAYQVPLSIWIGTILVMMHLSWVGVGAIAPATVWIITLIWTGTFYKSWFAHLPEPSMVAWAGALGTAWLLGLIVAVLLATTQQTLTDKKVNQKQVFLILMLLAGMGLQLGHLVYEFFGL